MKIFLVSSNYSAISAVNICTSINDDYSILFYIAKNGCRGIKVDELQKKFSKVKVLSYFQGKPVLTFFINLLEIIALLKLRIFYLDKTIYSQNYYFIANTFYLFPRSTNLLDEGFSSYTGLAVDFIHRKKLTKIFFQIPFLKGMRPTSLYLYRPDCANVENGSIELKKITTKISKDIDAVCSENNSYATRKKILMLNNSKTVDTLFTEPPKNLKSSVESIYDFVASSAQGDLIIRNHPSQMLFAIDFQKYLIDDHSTDWESQCRWITDDHIIISYFSTSVWVPKLLYQKQPVIIFLYKICGYNPTGADELVSRIRRSYGSEAWKVKCPSSYKELGRILNDE